MSTAALELQSRRGGLAHQVRILRVLAGTEYKLKYADSVLGYVWSLIKPLAIFGVLYYVFGRFFKIEAGFNHFALYLLVGIILWSFFADTTGTTMFSVATRGALLRRLSFPRVIVPLATALSATMTFGVNSVAVVAFVAWNRLTPRVEWLAIAPLLVELFVFTLGVSLVLATLFVRFRDIGQVWELALQILFFASPIIYPVGFLPPWGQPIAFLNPFVQVMQDLRAVLLAPHEQLPIETATQIYGTSAGRLLPIAVALTTLAAGLLLFRREAPSLAERV